jgi:hypothetical protein
METTKNKLPNDVNTFFKDLSKYLDTKLLFYGSVQRSDYFPGSSDIDVDVFTENVNSTITKMQHFLHVKKSSFKKIIWRLSHNGEMVYGYKIMYKNEDLNLSTEFSIYDKKYKDGVLEQHLKKTVLPFYATILLFIIKKLYYDLGIITKELYRNLKTKILSSGIGLPEEQFLVINVPNNK